MQAKTQYWSSNRAERYPRAGKVWYRVCLHSNQRQLSGQLSLIDRLGIAVLKGNHFVFTSRPASFIHISLVPLRSLSLSLCHPDFGFIAPFVVVSLVCVGLSLTLSGSRNCLRPALAHNQSNLHAYAYR